MRPTKDLRRLQAAGLYRLVRVRKHIERVLKEAEEGAEGTFATGLDPGIAVAVVELDNLWAGLARSLYLSTAFCARDRNGTALSLDVDPCRTKDEALGHAIKKWKRDVYDDKNGAGPWDIADEPAWGRTKHLLGALEAIGASNYDRVSAALSLAPKVFPYVHTLRNFYAHRSMEGRRQVEGVVRTHGIPTRYTPTRALVSPATGPEGVRHQPLILDWADELRETMELLV